ncbi:MAG: L-2-amino-thiazoline-4-carboxylic acid hydrolase [Ruminiclostridium sp.]|nr:L-2-amino-thiazoline-4-carboxylic acid hydrolase [Ruminiclostridium sp.]
MKYSGAPSGMWTVFCGSFRKALTTVLNYDSETARSITASAKQRYKKIIGSLPEFEKGDRFKTNIISCAMLSAFILDLPQKPTVEQMTEYYKAGMATAAMKWFCKKGAKKKFGPEDISGMKRTAEFRAADRNPYSWNMDFREYDDGSGYEAKFCKCGICTLMEELGLYEYIPAMCALDYTMAELSGVTDFVREYTLASGGPYCDCGYKKKV